MSQQSQTGSQSPLPVVEAKSVPFKALLYKSTITDITQISTLLKRHGLKISADIPVRVPALSECSCHPLKGNKKLKYAARSQEHLKTGALLPLKSYFRDYLNFIQISPFQLQTNGYRFLSALKSLYHIQHWGEPSPI